MSGTIKDIRSQLMGATCEVYTVEGNVNIYFGTIKKYDAAKQELNIYTRAEDNLRPAGLIYYTPVKLLVHGKTMHNQVIVLYGHVLRCAEDYLGIELKDVVTHKENRASFRVKTKVKTTLQPILSTDAEGEIVSLGDEVPCQIWDISLSGIGFSSGQSFRIGDQVLFPNLKLETSLSPYTLRCTIQRRDYREDITKDHLYGAVLKDMGHQEEELLCRDIFMMQAKNIKRK